MGYHVEFNPFDLLLRRLITGRVCLELFNLFIKEVMIGFNIFSKYTCLDGPEPDPVAPLSASSLLLPRLCFQYFNIYLFLLRYY